MASSTNVLKLGGYDYKFTGKVPDNFKCLVCLLPMKDPVQIVGCGHRLCSICLESLLRQPSPFCPSDRAPLSRDKIFPDSAYHREILESTVECPYFGCSWTGELRAVEKHQSECLLKEMQCSNSGCTERLAKKDMEVHESLECLWRKINCEHCQESFVFHEKQKHLEVCQKFPVPCTNNCGLREIAREKLEVHIRDECPKTEVCCEYSNLGCDAMFPRSNTSSHSSSQVDRHLSLTHHCLDANRLQVKDLVSLVAKQSQQIERLVALVKEESQKRERLEAQVKEESQKRERLVAQVKEEAQKRERLEAQVKEESQQKNRLEAHVKEESLKRERLVAQVKEESQHRKLLGVQIREESVQRQRLEAQVKKQSEQTEPLVAQGGSSQSKKNDLFRKFRKSHSKEDNLSPKLGRSHSKEYDLSPTLRRSLSGDRNWWLNLGGLHSEDNDRNPKKDNGRRPSSFLHG